MLHLLRIFTAFQETCSDGSAENVSAANYNVGFSSSRTSETTQATAVVDLENVTENYQCAKGT